MERELYPIKFNPLFKEKIWGGRNLEKILGKSLPPGQIIGESWEICDRGVDQTLVRNGMYAGNTLHDLMLLLRHHLLGNAFQKIPKRFPILFKCIDAQDDLSLQVHPNDQDAARLKNEDPGKTEMWYILSCLDHAKIMCGLKKGTDLEGFKQALHSPSVMDLLEVFTSKPGDVFFLPAGTVHALGKGNVVIEIQQNSDITYRLSDWGRIAAGGLKRPLHIDQGLKVIEWNAQTDVHPQIFLNQPIVQCPYFTVEKKFLSNSFDQPVNPDRFEVWIILEGRGILNTETYKKGEFILIPAHMEHVAGQALSYTQILKVLPGVK